MKRCITALFWLLCCVLLVQSAVGADWTVMVYLDGDNDLESAAIEDLNEMEQVGSNSNLNIVVLFDRVSGYNSSNGDWTDTRRGLVTADTDTYTISSSLTTVGEKNMADMKRYFTNLKNALLGREESVGLEGGIPYRVGPGCEDSWPKASLQIHWHPPLAAMQKAEPIKGVTNLGVFRSWIERHSFWRRSA